MYGTVSFYDIEDSVLFTVILDLNLPNASTYRCHGASMYGLFIELEQHQLCANIFPRLLRKASNDTPCISMPNNIPHTKECTEYGTFVKVVLYRIGYKSHGGQFFTLHLSYW